VVLDGTLGDEELSRDLSVRHSVRGKARDPLLLRGELVERIHGPLAGALAGIQQTGPTPPAPYHPRMGADDGYFPRGRSVLRQVHEERLVGVFYGQRALCVGALAPLNYVGTNEHTAAKATPFKRLAHTARWFEAIMLGSRAEADEVLAAVHKMHTRVHGTLSRQVGPHPAGTPYDAFDGELMLWTVAVMMDSAECFYDLFVRRLSDDEREALWRDYISFALLFGMPRDAAPETYPEFRAYYDGFLASTNAWLTDAAHYTGHAIAFEIPMAAHAQPFKRLHDLIMLGSLPPRVRSMYQLRWTPAHAVAFTTTVHALRGARRAMPQSVAHGRNTRLFDEVAQTEAWRIAHGHPTVELPIDSSTSTAATRRTR
jgi:uncharacterized protein (DUF2236 family)